MMLPLIDSSILFRLYSEYFFYLNFLKFFITTATSPVRLIQFHVIHLAVVGLGRPFIDIWFVFVTTKNCNFFLPSHTNGNENFSLSFDGYIFLRR
jgi:hypothetical protein